MNNIIIAAYLMFSKLRKQGFPYANHNKQEKLIQKNYTMRNVTHNKTSSLYSEIHKKKINNQSTAFLHNLFQTQQYLFQGSCNKSEKHGEGIMFLKNGMMVIGNWVQNILEGRVLIFTAFGGIICANYIDGKLNGWTIALYKDRVILITLYFQDKIDGQRIVFQECQNLWVASRYTHEGKFLDITHVEKGQKQKLPSFVDSDELEDFFNDFVLNKNYLNSKKVLQEIKIFQNTRYLGFTDANKIPSGLGVTFSNRQIFLGNFYQGSLNSFGRMIFYNGDIYQGHISNGNFVKEGIYYSPLKNTTTLLSSVQNQNAQVLEQFDGYTLLDFDLQIGLKISNINRGFEKSGIQKISECLQKYYSQYFIEDNIKEANQFSIISNPPSVSENLQNHFSDHESIHSNYSPKKIWSIPKGGWIEDEVDGESDPGKLVIKSNESNTSQKLIPIQKNNSQVGDSQRNPVNVENTVTFKYNNDNFQSIAIKENEVDQQKQKFGKQSPKKFQKKKMFKSDSDQNSNDSYSKSLEFYNKLGPSKYMKEQKKVKNSFKADIKNSKQNNENNLISTKPQNKNEQAFGYLKSQTELDPGLFGKQGISNKLDEIFKRGKKYQQNQNVYQNQEFSSSQVSNMSQKMQIMIKKSITKRKKIFQ